MNGDEQSRYDSVIILAWQVAGYWGADWFILPIFGAPWRPGLIARRGRVPVSEFGGG